MISVRSSSKDHTISFSDRVLLQWQPHHQTIVTPISPREHREVSVPGLGDGGVRLGSHGEGAEQPDAGVVHQLGGNAGQGGVVESISEIIMNLVRPHTKVWIFVKDWWTRVVGHVTVKSFVCSQVLRCNIEQLNDVITEHIPDNQEPISMILTDLVSTDDD